MRVRRIDPHAIDPHVVDEIVDDEAEERSVSERDEAPRQPGATTNIGLVLGAGGISGFAYHTGVLAVLQRLTGWDPRTADIVVGTSAGSNMAAVLRGGVPVSGALDRLLTVPTNPRSMARLRQLSGRSPSTRGPWSLGVLPAAPTLSARELLRGPFLRPLRLATGLLPAGRVRTDAIGDRAAELHPDGWPDEPMWIVSVRLDDGELVVFGRDPVETPVDVGTATEASSAIPSFFMPVRIGDHRYVDGGVHSPTNANLLLECGIDLDLVVVLSPMSGSLATGLQTVNGPMRLWANRVLRSELRQLHDAGIPTLVLEPSLDEARAMGTTLMDPSRVINVVLQTSSAARTALTEREVGESLDILREAARQRPSPVDVAYPE